MKVLLVDEHAAIRQGLRKWVNDVPGLEVAAELADARGILKAIEMGKIQLVIMGLCFAHCHGLTMLKELKEKYPRTRVLVYTAKTTSDVGVRAIRAGAAGFLCKGAPREDFSFNSLSM